VHLGFPRHVARELVLDTMQGSAEFALQSGKHVAQLRDMVTSPGGTSAEALYELERGGFRTVISDSVWAAFHRTLQLEAQLEQRAMEFPTVPPRTKGRGAARR
jgi:pyrroline-5-carboxylate reductase